MGLKNAIKKRLSKMNGRLRREGRRLASLVLCGVMVAGNLSAVPVSVLADSDSDHEFTYEIERAAMQEALQTAISEGDTVNEDLAFAGEYAEEYEQLLEADGTLYELEPVIADDDDDRDNALSLRVFARIEGDIPIDSMYEIDGTEEIVFLVSNKTEETVTASIYVNGLETEAITILPADAIPVANESSVVGSATVTSGTLSGGPSGGGSGSGGSAAGTPLEIEETGSAADEVRIEITDTTADDDTTTDPAIEDSNVSVVTDGDTQADEDEAVDNDPTEESQTSDDGEETDDLTGDTEEADGSIADDRTMDADQAEANNADANNKEADVTDTNNKDVVAADTDTKDGYEAADDTNDSDAKSEDADAANEDSKSDDGAGSDNTSDTADAENTDTSGETDTTGSSNTDTADNENGGSGEDTAGDNDNSDITEDSDVSVLGSAISVHRGILLAAGKATASDADETASDSDASNAIEGITYESVQLDKKGTAAFATTAADLKLDEVVLVEYTAQENDVAVTVTAPAGALPGGARLSVSLYEEDSEEYAAAGESVGYDAEDETTGMAAIDISFYDKEGEEVEPLASVTVNIDISSILPEEADVSTIEVQHLTETGDGVKTELVADNTDSTDGTVDEENTIVEFEVDSFSSFTITWRNSGGGSQSSDQGKSITATAYKYDDGKTTEEITISGGNNGGNNVTATYDDSVDLTSNNNKLSISNYTLETASVTYVLNGESETKDNVTSIKVTRESSSSGAGSGKPSQSGGGESYTYTYTIVYTDDDGNETTVTVTDPASISIALYYSGGSSSGNSNEEIDPTKYNSDSYVYWDTFTGSGSTASAGSSSTGVDSVTLGVNSQTSVTWADSGASSWSGGNQLSTYYPGAKASTSSSDYSTMQDGTLIITPSAGYYVTQVIIVCSDLNGNGAHTPYQCSTFANELAYDESFTISSSGVLTLTVNSKWFSHSSSADYYFILIKVSPIPSPLYVEYDYGDIVTIIDGSSYTDESDAFSTATGWTSTSTNENDYGTGNVQTEDTQYMYAYDLSDDDEENAEAASAWKHYANAITPDAKEQAAAAGYVFAGWKAEYYTSVTASDQDATESGYQFYYNNYDYNFDESSYYATANYEENDEVALTTNVRLIAQWIPIGITVTKEVIGLSGTELASESYSYTLTIERLTETEGEDGDTSETWVTYNTVTFTIAGDGTDSTILYPLPSETYRVRETEGNKNLESGTDTYYITVTAGGQIEITCDSAHAETSVNDDTVALLSDKELKVTNSYTSSPSTFSLKIIKTDRNDGTYLNGAGFYLYYIEEDGDEDPIYYYYCCDEDNNVTWKTDEKSAKEIKTESGGTITIGSIPAGTYYLKEVTAPDGYHLLNGIFELVVANGNVTVTSYSGTDGNTATVGTDGTDGSVTITVTNTAGSALPVTGGPGTTSFRIAGLLLTSCSAYLIYKTLRRRGGWLGE